MLQIVEQEKEMLEKLIATLEEYEIEYECCGNMLMFSLDTRDIEVAEDETQRIIDLIAEIEEKNVEELKYGMEKYQY